MLAQFETIICGETILKPKVSSVQVAFYGKHLQNLHLLLSKE